MNIIKIVWEDVYKVITPLDLVLYSSDNLVISSNKKLLKQNLYFADFSNIGIIVTSFILPNLKELSQNEYYVLEKNTNKPGIQIKNLREIYKNGIYICKMKNNPLYSYALNLKSTEFDKINDQLEISYYQIKQQETVKNYQDELKVILKDIKNLEKSLESNPPSPVSPSSTPLSTPSASPPSSPLSSPVSTDSCSSLDNQDLILKQIIKISEDFQTHLINKYIQLNQLVIRDFVHTKEYLGLVKKVNIFYKLNTINIFSIKNLQLFSKLNPILNTFGSFKYKVFKSFFAKQEKNISLIDLIFSIYQYLRVVDSQINIDDKEIHHNLIQNIFLLCK